MVQKSYGKLIEALSGEVILVDSAATINPLALNENEKQEVHELTLQNTYEFIEAFNGGELASIEKDVIAQAFKKLANIDHGVQIADLYKELLSQESEDKEELSRLVNIFKSLLGK